LFYYFWFLLFPIAIVWNTFAEAEMEEVEVAEVVVEVVTDREAVMEATEVVMEAATEVMEAMVGDGVGGLLIGGPLSGMTMNKTET
jgi:hypothetical protein